MKHKILNKIFLIMIISIFLILFSNNCFADEWGTESDKIMESIVDDLSPSKKHKDLPNQDPTERSTLIPIVSQAFTVLQFIGTGISIIMIMLLGIKYMLAGISEKAEIKKRATPILIGSILIVATVNILKLIQEIVIKSM